MGNQDDGMTRGKAWACGDDVSTDDIISGKYIENRDADVLAGHVLESIFDDFPKRVREGDIIIAGVNFGLGSSREQAPWLLKRLGIRLICARSFARIFYRNAMNLGLPLLEIPDGASMHLSTGDTVRWSLNPPIIEQVSSGERARLKPLPSFFLEIITHGGIIPWLDATRG